MGAFFLPESAKGTSEVTQNAQFILRGLTQFSDFFAKTHSDPCFKSPVFLRKVSCIFPSNIL